MEKNNFSTSCFISNVRQVLERNTIALREGSETISNLPITISLTDEENINTAHKLLAETLQYEPQYIRCLRKTSGPEELPETICVIELDSFIHLAVAAHSLYVLDRRIYSVKKSARNWISKLEKIVNGKTIAVYR